MLAAFVWRTEDERWKPKCSFAEREGVLIKGWARGREKERETFWKCLLRPINVQVTFRELILCEGMSGWYVNSHPGPCSLYFLSFPHLCRVFLDLLLESKRSVTWLLIQAMCCCLLPLL
jgi:hypothetical protein